MVAIIGIDRNSVRIVDVCRFWFDIAGRAYKICCNTFAVIDTRDGVGVYTVICCDSLYALRGTLLKQFRIGSVVDGLHGFGVTYLLGVLPYER